MLAEAAKREAEKESGEVAPFTESEFWAAAGAASQKIHESHFIS
jgi:hypothetical protein